MSHAVATNKGAAAIAYISGVETTWEKSGLGLTQHFFTKYSDHLIK